MVQEKIKEGGAVSSRPISFVTGVISFVQTRDQPASGVFTILLTESFNWLKHLVTGDIWFVSCLALIHVDCQ